MWKFVQEVALSTAFALVFCTADLEMDLRKINYLGHLHK